MTKLHLTALWEESISFFSFENLRLFVLAVLNNTHRSLLLGGKYFWWLLLILFGARATSSLWLENITSLLLFFFFVLIARPSVERKDHHYFMLYLQKFPGYLLLSFLFIFCWFSVDFVITRYCYSCVSNDIANPSLRILFGIIVPRLIITSLLFFIDLPTQAKSIIKAAKNSLIFCLAFIPVIATFVLIEAVLLSLPQIFCFFITWQVKNSQIWTVVSLALTALVRLFALNTTTLYYVKIRQRYLSLFFQNK